MAFLDLKYFIWYPYSDFPFFISLKNLLLVVDF